MSTNSIDLKDQRFSKLYEELLSVLDEGEEEEVYFFEHGNRVLTRTAIISNGDEFLIIQSHYGFGSESLAGMVRLPHSAIKFMAEDILARSIRVHAFKVGLSGYKALQPGPSFI